MIDKNNQAIINMYQLTQKQIKEYLKAAQCSLLFTYIEGWHTEDTANDNMVFMGEKVSEIVKCRVIASANFDNDVYVWMFYDENGNLATTHCTADGYGFEECCADAGVIASLFELTKEKQDWLEVILKNVEDGEQLIDLMEGIFRCYFQWTDAMESGNGRFAYFDNREKAVKKYVKDTLCREKQQKEIKTILMDEMKAGAVGDWYTPVLGSSSPMYGVSLIVEDRAAALRIEEEKFAEVSLGRTYGSAAQYRLWTLPEWNVIYVDSYMDDPKGTVLFLSKEGRVERKLFLDLDKTIKCLTDDGDVFVYDDMMRFHSVYHWDGQDYAEKLLPECGEWHIGMDGMGRPVYLQDEENRYRFMKVDVNCNVVEGEWICSETYMRKSAYKRFRDKGVVYAVSQDGKGTLLILDQSCNLSGRIELPEETTIEEFCLIAVDEKHERIWLIPLEGSADTLIIGMDSKKVEAVRKTELSPDQRSDVCGVDNCGNLIVCGERRIDVISPCSEIWKVRKFADQIVLWYFNEVGEFLFVTGSVYGAKKRSDIRLQKMIQ